MTILDKAITFAVQAHSGTTRKGTQTPYIVHPMEAAAIASSMTDDVEVIAAAVLHDVVEDTPYTQTEVEEHFGKRIASLVASNSEDKREDRPAAETWKERKQETIDHLMTASREEKILALSDKLSNLRSIYRDYLEVWDDLWDRFNQKDPEEQLWYYKSFLDTCAELSDTEAYQEYKRIYRSLGSYVQEYLEFGCHKGTIKILSTPGDGKWVFEDVNTGDVHSMTHEEFQNFCRAALKEDV